MQAQVDLERIERYLEEGERVLWVGRSNPGLAAWRELRRVLGLLALLGVPACASVALVSVRWGRTGLTIGALLSWGSVVCAPLVLVVLVPLLWALLRWSMTQYCYAVTTRAFLWMRPHLWPLSGGELLVRRFSLREAYDLQVVQHGDGIGTLTFLGMWLPTLPRRFPVHPSFHAVAHVGRVLDISREAAQRAGFVEQPRPDFARQVLQTIREEALLYVGASILATLFSVVVAVEMGSSDLSQSTWFAALQLPRGPLLAVGALMALALGALVGSFQVREILRRYPHLHGWQAVLLLVQAGLLLVWLGMVSWIAMAAGQG